MRVRGPVASSPEVDDGAATAELGLALDLDVAMPRLDELGMDDVRDRDGVVDRRSRPAVRRRGGSG